MTVPILPAHEGHLISFRHGLLVFHSVYLSRHYFSSSSTILFLKYLSKGYFGHVDIVLFCCSYIFTNIHYYRAVSLLVLGVK